MSYSKSDEKLDKLLNKVKDEESFLKFAEALYLDWIDEVEKEKKKPSPPYSSGANGWENGTIDAFLEASVAWARSGGKDPSVDIGNNLWKYFAAFLYAGKHYE